MKARRVNAARQGLVTPRNPSAFKRLMTRIDGLCDDLATHLTAVAAQHNEVECMRAERDRWRTYAEQAMRALLESDEVEIVTCATKPRRRKRTR